MQQKIANGRFFSNFKNNPIIKKLNFMALLETVGVPQCTNTYLKNKKYNGANTPLFMNKTVNKK